MGYLHHSQQGNRISLKVDEGMPLTVTVTKMTIMLRLSSDIKLIKELPFDKAKKEAFTVNPKIFARILFSQIALKDIFGTPKIHD